MYRVEVEVGKNNVRVLESEHLKTLISTAKLMFSFTFQSGNKESVLLLNLTFSLVTNPSILY